VALKKLKRRDKMQGIELELTKEQTKLLEPMFEKVRLGSNYTPGAIFAQIFESTDAKAFMLVRFIDAEISMNIQDCLGTERGKIQGNGFHTEVYTSEG